MARASLRLFRPFSRSRSRSRSSRHLALSPSTTSSSVPPNVPHSNPSAPPPPFSWQQFSRLPCLPCRPLVDLQNLGSKGQHDRNAKEVSQPGINAEPGTSEWSLQCRRNLIHIPPLHGISALYGASTLYGVSASYGTSCRIQRLRSETSEDPEAGDRERHVTKLKDDVAKVSSTVAKVSSTVAVSEADVADVTNILLSLGCTKAQLQRILKKKCFALVRHRCHILRKADIFRRYGIDSHLFLKTLERDSRPNQLFLSSPDGQHESVLNYLQNTLKLNHLGKVVCTQPAVLNYLPSSIESKLQLWSNLGVPLTVPMVEKYPGVFTFSEKNIQEGIEGVKAIFPHPLGATVLSKFPFLAFMKSEPLKERANGLREFFGYDLAQRLLVKTPSILMANISTMRHTYTQLQHHFGEERCLKMVTVQPALLGRHWDSLVPKLEYLLKEMGRNIEEVGRYPSIFTLSLEKRLRRRHDVLVKQNVEWESCSLPSILGHSDEEFEKKFNVSLPR